MPAGTHSNWGVSVRASQIGPAQKLAVLGGASTVTRRATEFHCPGAQLIGAVELLRVFQIGRGRFEMPSRLSQGGMELPLGIGRAGRLAERFGGARRGKWDGVEFALRGGFAVRRVKRRLGRRWPVADGRVKRAGVDWAANFVSYFAEQLQLRRRDRRFLARRRSSRPFTGRPRSRFHSRRGRRMCAAHINRRNGVRFIRRPLGRRFTRGNRQPTHASQGDDGDC